jgi:hypothetical protein
MWRMSVRENGYYWCKWRFPEYGKHWTIAQWCGTFWRVLEKEDLVEDDCFREIGDLIPIPEKYKEPECPKA